MHPEYFRRRHHITKLCFTHSTEAGEKTMPLHTHTWHWANLQEDSTVAGSSSDVFWGLTVTDYKSLPLRKQDY